MAEHTTLMLHGDMEDHLGACVSENRWAWMDADKIVQSPNGEEFAKALEKKVSKEYANWFRKEVGLATPAYSEFIEFGDLKVEVKFAQEGLYPIVHTQSRRVGNFLKGGKKVDGITIKVMSVPEIMANTLYLGGVNESGDLVTKRHVDPDQKSKTPDERAAVVKKIFAALEKMGKAKPQVFGTFIKNTTHKSEPETVKMTSSYTLEFADLKVVLEKPAANKLVISVPKQSKTLGAWLHTTNPQMDGYTFKCQACPEFSGNTIFLHGIHPDGSLRSGSESGRITYGSSSSLDSHIPILAALKKLGLAHPDKFGAFVSSDFDTPAADQSEFYLSFQNLKVEIKKEGSRITITVPHQAAKVGAHLYSVRTKDGVRFETAGLPHLHRDKIFLHGCDRHGVLESTRPDAKSYTHPIKEGTDISRNLLALKAYGLEHSDIFGEYVSDNFSGVSASAQAPTTTESASKPGHFVKFDNLEIRMELVGRQLHITVPRQTKALGKFLYTRRAFDGFQFETHSCPELKSSNLLFLAGCNSDGHMSTSENTHMVTFSEDYVKTALSKLVAFGKTKPEYFGSFISSSVSSETVPSVDASTSTDRFEIKTPKFHMRVTFPGTNYKMEIFEQHQDIGTFLFTRRQFERLEIETWSNCYINVTQRKIQLGGVSGPDKVLTAESSGRVCVESCNKEEVLALLETLRKFIISKSDIFGVIEGHVAEDSALTGETLEIETPKFHVVSTIFGDTAKIKFLKQDRVIGTHFWDVRRENGSEFETYSTCGICSDKRLRLHGVNDRDGSVRDAARAKEWEGSSQYVKTRLQDLYTYILKNSELFGPVTKVVGLTSATTAPVDTTTSTWPTFHFVSDNLDIKVTASKRQIYFEVLKQTREVTNRCRGEHRPKIDDIQIVSSGCPEISTTIFFLAGTDETCPVNKRQPVSWETPEDATAQLTKHFNALRQAAIENPDAFGSIKHTSWTSEEVMPRFVADRNTLTLETENLRVEVKYNTDGTVFVNIPKQSTGVGSHLWQRRMYDGIYFETAHDFRLSSSGMFLRPCRADGQLKDLPSHTFDEMGSEESFKQTVKVLTALKGYASSNPSIFGRYIGDNLTSVSCQTIRPVIFDVGTCEYYAKFENYHIGISVAESSVKMWMPVQTPAVTDLFRGNLQTDTFEFRSRNCPEWKFAEPLIFVRGDQPQTRSENRIDGMVPSYQRERAANAITSLVKAALERRETFGALIATNVSTTCAATSETVAATAPVKVDDVAPQSAVMVFGLNMLAVNKEAVIIETKRQLGKTILGQAQSRVGENLPDMLKPIFGTPLGKILVANSLVVAADFYTGPHKDKVDIVTESVLSAAASDVGDWFDISGLIDGFINSVKK